MYLSLNGNSQSIQVSMMEERKLYQTTNCDLWSTGSSETLCVLVHGLGGNKESSYWGATSKLLRYEKELGRIDYCFWQYSSNKSPFANLMALVRGGRTLAKVSDVSSSLATEIEHLVGRNGYKEVSLMGHSLGGYVVLHAAELLHENRTSVKIKRLCFMSMPERLSTPVRLLTNIFKWNPHIKWLGSNALKASRSSTLSNLRLAGIETCYCQSTLDEIAYLEEKEGFDKFVAFEAVHSWPSQIADRKNTAYITLLRWLSGRL
jgi:pimeloyl-ACP methyl ester carboxylesterase